MNAKRIEHYEKILPEVAKHSSEMERRADEAERECDKLKKVQYMSGHLGEEFWGVISGVTEWGFYVELPNTVEGLVHVTTLTDDYFHYSESTYELIGETTAKRYKLGQKVPDHIHLDAKGGSDRFVYANDRLSCRYRNRRRRK